MITEGGDEHLFLSVSPGLEHGPGIQRDGISNPRMTDPHSVPAVPIAFEWTGWLGGICLLLPIHTYNVPEHGRCTTTSSSFAGSTDRIGESLVSKATGI